MVFSGRDGGGKRKRQVTSAGSVFTGRRALLNIHIFLCYILYIEQWKFRCCMLQTIVNGARRGCCTSFRHGLHRPVGMVSYAHTVYVTCYFCYIFTLGPSSASTGSGQIYRSACERYTPNIYRCIPT
jgi:hypothetical protein